MPELLKTRRELAAAMGVHQETVQAWVRSGCPVAHRGGHGRRSLFREADVRAWLAARDQARQTRTRELEQERARLARAQAMLAEQTYRTRTQELLMAEAVERVSAREREATRAIVLEAYAAAAERVYRASAAHGVAGVEHALKEIAFEVLRELAKPERSS
jgi:excisionase family DNA binding protein